MQPCCWEGVSFIAQPETRLLPEFQHDQFILGTEMLKKNCLKIKVSGMFLN